MPIIQNEISRPLGTIKFDMLVLALAEEGEWLKVMFDEDDAHAQIKYFKCDSKFQRPLGVCSTVWTRGYRTARALHIRRTTAVLALYAHAHKRVFEAEVYSLENGSVV